ncbi:MAG: phage tail protein [Cetobacterium sp.]
MEQYNFMPIGSIVIYAGKTTPVGWLICDGRAITELSYPDLYKIVGANVPNLVENTNGVGHIIKALNINTDDNSLNVNITKLLNDLIEHNRLSLFNKTDSGGYIGTTKDLDTRITESISCPHRVGDILTTTKAGNPGATWVNTTWQKIEGYYLKGSSSGDVAMTTGGSMAKTISIENLPKHKHDTEPHKHDTEPHKHDTISSSHAHTQPTHRHNLYATQWSVNGSGGITFTSGTNAGQGGATGYATDGGGDTTGDATPVITVKDQTVLTKDTPLVSNTTGSGEALNIEPSHYIVHYWLRVS